MQQTFFGAVAGISLTILALGAGSPLLARELAAVRVDTLAHLEAGTGGISIDAAGNVYSSDFGGYLARPVTMGTRIYRITPSGEVSLFVADGLNGASGSAIDGQGVFYQSNIRSGVVTRILPDGSTTQLAEGLHIPVGIELDSEGNLLVANCGSQTVTKVTLDGAVSLFAEGDLFRCPNGIVRDPEGNVYVANFRNGDVVRIAADGTVSRLATVPGDNNGHLLYVQPDRKTAGVLLVVARSAHQIYRVTLDGEVAPFAGSGAKGHQDGPASEASFCYPNDLGLSPDGRILYINEVADLESDGSKIAPTIVRRIFLEP